jgi:hypothetical protein
MISASITHHSGCNATATVIPARLTEANVLSEKELAAIAGAAWNWGGMFFGGLQGAVYTGLGNAAQAAYHGQPIGAAGIGQFRWWRDG